MKNFFNLLLIFISIFSLGFAGYRYGNDFAAKHEELKFEIISISHKNNETFEINETIEIKFNQSLKKPSINSNSIFAISSNQEKLLSPSISYDEANNSIKISFDKKMLASKETAEVRLEITDSILNASGTKLENPITLNYTVFRKIIKPVTHKNLQGKIKSKPAKKHENTIKTANNSQVSLKHQNKR